MFVEVKGHDSFQSMVGNYLIRRVKKLESSVGVIGVVIILCSPPLNSYPIIKRRIAWIIGKWIIEDPTTAENSRAWEVLTLLLTNRSQGTDAVVRLTAALSLKGAINVGVSSVIPFK